MSTITVHEFGEVVEYNIDNGIKRSILGLGGSGIGKSAKVAQISKERNIGFKDLRLLLYTETDLKGIPFPNKEDWTTRWLSNNILPIAERDGDKGILLIEELTSAPKRVQAAAYQLIHDRQIGEYKLPDGWYIVALGNREDDDGVYIQMPSPLSNRFEIHEIRPSLEIWKQDFAFPQEVNPLVISYLNFKPSAIHNYKPGSNMMVFATPRSWTAVSDILNSYEGKLTDNLVRMKVIGNVGEIEANSFLEFCGQKQYLPSADKIIKGQKVKVPRKDDHLYLLIGSIVAKLADIRYAKTLDDVGSLEGIINAVKFLLKLKPELTVLGLKDLVYLNKPLVKAIFLEEIDDGSILEFIKEHKYIFA